MLSKSAAKRLGLETADLLNNCLSPEKKGALQANEFKVFWSTVDLDAKEANVLMMELLKRLVTVAEENQPQAIVSVPLECLLNTVAFVAFYGAFVPDSRIARAVKLYHRGEEGEKAPIRAIQPLAKEVMRSLGLMVEKQDAVSALLNAATNLHTGEELSRLGDIVSRPAVDETGQSAAGFLAPKAADAFFYFALKNIAYQSEEKRMSILTTCANKMLSLPQQIKLNPIAAQKALLAYLHIVKNILAIAAVPDRELLRKLQSVIQPFYLWPAPYGLAAREALIQLHNELMFPGAALLGAISSEAFTAEYTQVVVDNIKSKAVYYLFDADSQLSAQWSKLMELRAPSEFEKSRRASNGASAGKRKIVPASLQPNLQALVILYLLAGDDQVGAAEQSMMEKIMENQAKQLYMHVETMLLECTKNIIVPEQALDHRRKALLTLRAELERASKNPSSAAGAKAVLLPPNIAAPYTPRLPPLTHIQAKCSSLYTFDDKEALRIMFVDYTTFPTTSFTDELDSIFSGFAAAPKPCEIRLVVAGDDQLFHQFLCAYMRVVQTSPQWISGISVKLFLLPWGKNGVSAFLARHDSWYYRHVYLPFRTQLFLVPWLQSDTSESISGSKDDAVNKPGLFFRDIVGMYLREAQNSCDLVVYQLEGWKPEGLRTPVDEKFKKLEALADQKIPFIQRAEFGVLADVEAFRLKKQFLPDTPVEELMRHKDFTPNLAEVDISFTKVDFSGKFIKVIDEDSMVINSLALSSVPRFDGGVGGGNVGSSGGAAPVGVVQGAFPANPTSGCLELLSSCQPPKSGRKSLLASEPHHHINEITVSAMQPNQGFYVLLDSQSFGPFTRVKISRVLRSQMEMGSNAGAPGASGAPGATGSPVPPPTTPSAPPSLATSPSMIGGFNANPPNLVSANSVSSISTTTTTATTTNPTNPLQTQPSVTSLNSPGSAAPAAASASSSSSSSSSSTSSSLHGHNQNIPVSELFKLSIQTFFPLDI